MYIINLASDLTFLAECDTMNIHDINPYIRVAMPSRFPSHHLLKERIIFDYELIYLEEGSFEFGYAGTTYQCRAGDFIFIRPNIPHYFRTGSDEASQPHIHFDLNYAPDSGHVFVSFKNLPDMSPAERRLIRQDAFFNYPTNPFVNFSEPDSLLELFYEIIDPKTPLHTLRKKALMTEVINRLIQDNFPACFAEESQSLSPASQLKAYIDAGQGLQYNLDDFETQFFYSKFYLERQFKQLFGISVMSYQHRKRMDIAKELLDTKSVTDTAKEIGYGSIYSFSRAFKTHFGMSPSEYKGSKKKPGL